MKELKKQLDGQTALYAVNEDTGHGDGGHETVVDQPDHYKQATFEMIDEAVLAFGVDATISFCIINAWKYRARAPYKDNPKQDMEKADRYMQYAHDLQLKKALCETGGGVAVALPLLKADGYTWASVQQEDESHGPRR